MGYESRTSVREVLELSYPYLPYDGALGERVLSTGGAIYLHGKGADGIVDVSPFTCMNGIVTEAIYPAVSRDLDGMPIRTFYFDDTQSDMDRDIGIFLELAAPTSAARNPPGDTRHPSKPPPSDGGRRFPEAGWAPARRRRPRV